MARGVLSGLIWGAVVAGVGAGGLSLAYPDFKPGGSKMPAPAGMAGTDTATENQAAPAAEAGDTDTDTAAADDTAAPPGAETVTDETMSKADAVAEEEMAEGASAQDDAPEPALAEDAPGDDGTQSSQEAPQTAQVDAPVEPVADETADNPVADTDPVQPAQEDTEPQPDTAPVPDAPAEDPAQSATDEIIAALPQPSGTVGNLAENVTTGRLPSVSGDETAEDSNAGPSAVAPPPLERFAADVTFDDSKPLMSIVLIDDGETELGFDALESFPYPLTFAVDASAPNAAERMSNYRARGLEVMAMVSLPQGATAADAEVAMAAYLAAVPEAVALLEDPSASLQTNRGLSDQVTQILQSTGHGIVFQASGLNTAQKLALREGVASAKVFRDFDGSDQNATVIRRFLDQAAFKANQEGAVVMLGRLRAETISALLIWGLADRASRVALVPVSTVLTKGLREAE